MMRDYGCISHLFNDGFSFRHPLLEEGRDSNDLKFIKPFLFDIDDVYLGVLTVLSNGNAASVSGKSIVYSLEQKAFPLLALYKEH